MKKKIPTLRNFLSFFTNLHVQNICNAFCNINDNQVKFRSQLKELNIIKMKSRNRQRKKKRKKERKERINCSKQKLLKLKTEANPIKRLLK